jgi:putative oxidoreductase
MFNRIIRTSNDMGLGILRLMLGIVFLAHGGYTMLGWFGGPGYSAAIQTFAQTLGIPAALAFLSMAAEFFGGLGLIVGFLGRIAALGIIVNMVAAIMMVHLPFGFFMNWTGTKPGEGFEYHLLVIAMGFAVLINGSGALSIDRALSAGRTNRITRIDRDRAAA